ncbi:hypothetical protein [Chitinophaga sp. CF418]|uniref:hypothetical protein n=1 Tax=Chitinophaga sp. CF418 TaxID=1855287 RepID=UPI0009176887|nr:hypothetical protein [Chitinophaga sp. CF418]SHM23319.1 hypothetical protein SAMN05216311_101915 [Chitinophaga sp. CF418]
MNSNTPTFKLTVTAVGVMSDFAHITVYNGFLEDIARGYEQLDLTLPQGLYSITLKLDGNIIKEHVRLTEDTRYEIPTPPVYSSLVADRFESSHEYYTHNAQHYSLEPTVQTSTIEGGAIFLFFRYTDLNKRKELNTEQLSLGDGFSLLDANRQILYTLQGSNIREDTETGWMAFHAVLPVGTYYLHYSGYKFESDDGRANDLPAREIPLQVFKSSDSLQGLPDKYWQTQVFLTFGYGPIFPSMSVFIAPRKSGFINNDEGNYRIDGLRHKFHNGVYYLPEKVLLEFEQGQWISPMKGLLAAYVYFSSPETDNELLFRNIAQDLPALLGEDTPEVKALQVMAAQYYKDPIPELTLSQPCMFLAGVRSVIRASIKHPDIIAEDSLLEDITDKLYCDMVWTSYLPDPIPEVKEQMADTAPGSSLTASIFNVVERIIGGETTPEEIGEKLLQSQTVSTLLYYIEKLNDDLNVNDLASRLQIPPNVVRKTINHILAFSDSIKDVKRKPDQFNISNINKLKSIQ